MACVMLILISLEDYRDIESLNAYKRADNKKKISRPKQLWAISRQLDVTMHVHQCSGTHLTMAALHQAHHAAGK